MQLPTDREIRDLHREHAPTREAFESVHTHCELVCRIAEQFLSRVDVDGDLVDYIPGSPEEELVLYADKFHSKRTPPVFVSGDSYAEAVGRWGADKVIAFGRLRQRYGDPDLKPLTDATGYALV